DAFLDGSAWPRGDRLAALLVAATRQHKQDQQCKTAHDSISVYENAIMKSPHDPTGNAVSCHPRNSPAAAKPAVAPALDRAAARSRERPVIVLALSTRRERRAATGTHRPRKQPRNKSA